MIHLRQKIGFKIEQRASGAAHEEYPAFTICALRLCASVLLVTGRTKAPFWYV